MSLLTQLNKKEALKSDLGSTGCSLIRQRWEAAVQWCWCSFLCVWWNKPGWGQNCCVFSLRWDCCCFLTCRQRSISLPVAAPKHRLSAEQWEWASLAWFSSFFPLTAGTDGHMDRNVDAVSGCEGTACFYMCSSADMLLCLWHNHHLLLFINVLYIISLSSVGELTAFQPLSYQSVIVTVELWCHHWGTEVMVMMSYCM